LGAILSTFVAKKKPGADASASGAVAVPANGANYYWKNEM
jgi:hypothetical protein